MISIRSEEPKDHEAVYAINLAAFEGGPEADLEDILRSSCAEYLSLVAEDGGEAVGHILFTPGTIESPTGGGEGMGLAPMAVTPARHRCGVGSQFVNENRNFRRHTSVKLRKKLRSCREQVGL